MAIEDNLKAAWRGYHEVVEVPRSVIGSDPAAIAKGRQDHRASMTATNAFFV